MPSYTINGTRWNVKGAVVVSILNDFSDPKAYHPKFIVGCDICQTFCIDSHACECCKKNSRPLDGTGTHGPIIETTTFVAKIKKAA